MAEHDPSKDLRAKARSLFYAALDHEPNARISFVKDACKDSDELRNELLSLLDAYNDATSFLESTPTGELAADNESVIGRRLGDYLIQDILAVGGMGVVFTATQQKPRRTVALKLVKPELSSSRVLRRFELEAELLGQLLHPGIAQIYEAGTAETRHGKRPFLAMELVDGLPLTEFVTESTSTVLQVIQLFCKVCDAVHHAHQKGVLHRDLKPSNILVDKAGQPKILDFGVARAMNDKDGTLFATQSEGLVGTIPYMSPEQVQSSGKELDTRSDVYALGVVFYETLTGSLPYSLRDKPIPDALRVIAEADAVPLSKKLPSLRGDLENVLGKALAKDPGHRYQSASDLGADLRRFLNCEPVTARTPTRLYQFQKFVQRNKGLVAGLALALLLLILGSVVSTVLLFQTIKARNAETEATKTAKRRAELNAAINSILEGMLVAPDPWRSDTLMPIARDTKVVDVIDNAAALLEQDEHPPEVEAWVRGFLGKTYIGLELLDQAEPQVRRSLELNQELYGEADRRTVEAHEVLAGLYFERGEFEKAEDIQRQCVEQNKTLLGERHELTLVSMSDLALYLHNQERWDRAEALYRETLALSRQSPAVDPIHIAVVLHNLGSLLEAQMELEEAEQLLQQAYDIRAEHLGPTHARTLVTLNGLAVLYQKTGDVETAARMLEQILEQTLEVFGEHSLRSLRCRLNLAIAYYNGSHLDASERLFEEIVQAPDDGSLSHQEVLVHAYHALGQIYRAQRRFAEAESVYRETLRLSQAAAKEDPHDLAANKANLAATLLDQNRPQEAEPLLADAAELALAHYDPKDPNLLFILVTYANALRILGRWDRADELLARTIDLIETRGLEGRLAAIAYEYAGDVFQQIDFLEEAEAHYAEALERYRELYSDDDSRVRRCAQELIQILEAGERLEEAEALQAELPHLR